MAVRAEVGRLPGPARERLGGAAPVVPQRAAAASLLPRARGPRRPPAGTVLPRRRDRDRAGRRPRLRRDADEAPSRREPRAQAVGGDPCELRRLRRARLGRRRALAGTVGRAPKHARGARGRLPALAVHARPGRGARVALVVRGDRARRRDRQAARRALPRGRAHGGREGEAREDGRLRRRRPALEGRRRPADRDAPARPVGRATATSTTSAPPRSLPHGTTRSRRRCCHSSRTRPSAVSRSRTAGAAASSRRRRSGRRSSSRCATTRCRAGASGTARSSSGSAPTRIRRSAPGGSSGRRSSPASPSPTCSSVVPRTGAAGRRPRARRPRRRSLRARSTATRPRPCAHSQRHIRITTLITTIPARAVACTSIRAQYSSRPSPRRPRISSNRPPRATTSAKASITPSAQSPALGSPPIQNAARQARPIPAANAGRNQLVLIALRQAREPEVGERP